MKNINLPDGASEDDWFHVYHYQVKGLQAAIKEQERLNSERTYNGEFPHPFRANVGWLPPGMHPDKNPVHVVVE